MQPHAAASPVVRLDKGISLHEFINQLLRLILRDGAPPVELAFLLCGFDDFGIGKDQKWLYAAEHQGDANDGHPTCLKGFHERGPLRQIPLVRSYVNAAGLLHMSSAVRAK